MRTIQTKSGELLLVKVPEEAYLIAPIDNPKFKYSIRFVNCPEIHFIKYNELNSLGKFSQLKNEDLEEFVDSSTHLSGDVMYRDYTFEEWEDCATVQDSFISLCKSQGIEDDLDNYLIIKKI